MSDIPKELGYVLAFAALMLFQYLMKRFGPQPQQDTAPLERLPEIPGEVKELPTAPSASSVDAGLFGRSGAPSAASAFPRRRFARRSLMGNKKEVQNAIVIATILGPCRSFEPHGVR